MKKSFHNRIKKFQITREQWGILSLLYDHKSMNQKSLAQVYNRDPAALAKTLDRMERNNLIKRLRDEHDKRAYQIHLTDKGIRIRQQIEPLAKESISEAFSNFTGEELETLKTLLLKLAD